MVRSEEKGRELIENNYWLEKVKINGMKIVKQSKYEFDQALIDLTSCKRGSWCPT
jgi:hypothetical protein